MYNIFEFCTRNDWSKSKKKSNYLAKDIWKKKDYMYVQYNSK